MNDRKIISDSELEKIMLASARALPDAPSDRGMRPAQIKRALSEPVRMLVQMLNTKLNGLAVDGDGVGDIGSSAYKETSIENLYSCTSWYDELERDESNFVVDRINPSESVTIDCMHPFTLKPSLLSLPEWSIELSAHTEAVGNVLNFYTADNYLRVKCISGKYEFSYLINSVENSIVKDAEGESVITLVKSEDVISVYFNGEAVIKIKLPSNNYSFTIHQIGNDVGYIFNYLKTFGRAISEGEIEKNVIAAEYRRKKINNGEKTKLDLIFKYALEHFKIEQLINELKAADVEINSKLEELEGADSESKESINDIGEELDDLKEKAVGALEVSLSNDKDYILTINVKDVNGQVTETHTVNLPLEKIVIDGKYVTDVEHGKCIQLTLDSGSVIHIPIGDLVSGLASQSSVDALSASVNVLKENMAAFEDTLEEMDTRLSDVENAQKNLNIDIDNKIASKAEQGQVDALQQEQSLIAPLARGAARSLSISKKKYTSGVDTFEYEFTLKDYLGNPIGEPVPIDLPLEEMIVDATYDNTEKVILLHLKNENIVPVPLADLITGIENKIAENYATKVALNEVSTLSSGDASNSGWYRIAEYDGKGIASVAQGSYGNSCDIIIKKVYNTGDAEAHHLQLVSRYGNSYFQSLYSYCGYQQISKMRHVVDIANHKAYIDLYYDPSSRNSISVQIINGKGFGDFMWKAIAPAAVYDTSTNESVQTEYIIPTSAKNLTSANIGVEILSEEQIDNKVAKEKSRAEEVEAAHDKRISAANALALSNQGSISALNSKVQEIDGAYVDANDVKGFIDDALDNFKGDITVDMELSGTSTHPIANKVVTEALNGKLDKGTGTIDKQKVLVTDQNGKIVSSSVGSDKLNYIAGLKSGAQAQIDNINTDISNLDTRVTEIDSMVDGHTLSLNGLKSRLNTVEADVDARAKTIEYSWESKSAGVDLFKLNLELKDANGNQLSKIQIDFPLEQMVVGAEYDKVNKKLILLLPDTYLEVPVADIFEGLVTDSNIGDKTAGKAKVLETARKITFEGDVTGEYTFDGSSGEIVTLTVADDSHNHVISNIDGLQAALDNKADKTALDDTNATVVGHTNALNDLEPRVGALEEGKLDKSGGTLTGEIAIGQGDGNGIQLGKLGYINATNNDGSNKTCTLLGVNAPQGYALVGHSQFDLQMRGKGSAPTYNGNTVIHSGNIGSQHVASATNLISSSEYGVKTDQYGNLHQIKHTSGACWQVVNANGTAMLSVFFDGSEVRVGTNPVLHAGNYETYIRNYMNKTILEQPY